MVKHIVLFSYKKEASDEQLTALHEKFSTLPSLIPEILSFESGKDVSVENRHHGFTDAYVVSFAGEKERDSYLTHPHHVVFSEFAGPLLKDVLVFDYLTD